MLTITDTWRQYAETDGAKLFAAMTITVNTATGTHGYKFCSGMWPAQDTFPILETLTPVATELKVLSRDLSRNAMTATLIDDGTFREIAAGYALKNAAVSIDLQYAEDTTRSDTQGYWSGFVDDWSFTGGKVTLRMKDPLQAYMGEIWRGDIINLHPLQAAEKILNEVGVYSSRIDTTALDPANALYSGISHLVVTSIKYERRGGDSQNGVHMSAGTPSIGLGDLFSEGTGTTVGSWLKYLGNLCGGTFYADENGKITFAFFDSAASADRTWTGDDISDLELVSGTDGMINSIDLEYGHVLGPRVYQEEDTDAQDRYSDPLSGDPRIYSYQTEIPLAGNGALLMEDIDASQTTGIYLAAWQLSGFSGTRIQEAAHGDDYKYSAGDIPDPWHGLIPADARITPSRPLYVRIGNEVIKAESIHRITADNFNPLPSYFVWEDLDRYGDPTGTRSFLPNVILLDDVTRGALGTTAKAHGASVAAWDSSVPYTVTTWSFSYNSGTGAQPVAGDQVTGSTSGAIGVVWLAPTGTAASGGLVLRGIEENLIVGETVTSGSWSATVSSVPAVQEISGNRVETLNPTGLAYDITALVWRAGEIMARHVNGAPMITLSTSLAEFDVQIGDTIAINHPTAPFAWYGHETLTDDLLWEVTGKEVDVVASQKRIKWKLTYASETSPPAAVIVRAPVRGPYATAATLPSFVRGAINQSFAAGHVAAGADLSIDTGRDLNFSPGDIGIGGRIIEGRGRALPGIPASSDNHIYFNAETDSLEVMTRPTGSTRPATPMGSTYIGLVETDATSITGITQTARLSRPLEGTKVVDATIGFRQQNTVDSESFGGANILPNGDIGTFSRGAAFPPDGWEVG